MARNNTHKKRIGKKIYAIIVDGETEVWYFQMMKRHESLLNIDIRPELPKKKKLADQYNSVIENKNLGYDKIIWLLDMDTILKEDKQTKKGQQSKLQELKRYIKKLKKYSQVEVLVNTPCLEFWHLLHFKETSKYYAQCESAAKELRQYLPNYEKTQRYYKQANSDIYQRLKPLQETAHNNAKKLGRFDFEYPQSAKAEMYSVLDILGII